MAFSDSFPVTNGVKHGCVLASTLFSMIISTMLTDAFQDCNNDIPILGIALMESFTTLVVKVSS